LNGQGNNLTKVDTGSIDIRCVVTNLASLTVSNVLIFYENIDQTNTWTATTTNYVRPGASLGVYGGRFFGMPVVLDAATILNQGGGTPLWVGPVRIDTGSLFNNAAAQNFYGLIDGSGPMWVNGGTAALTLSNANTYSGGTIISNAPVTTSAVDAVAGSAAVIAAHPNAFGAGPVTIDGSAYGSLTTNAAFFTTNVLRAVEFAFAAPGTVPNNIILPSTIITNVSLHGRTSGQVVNLAGVISGGFTGMTNWVDFGDATANGVMRYGNTANTFLGTIAVFRGWLGITADGSLGNPANILRLNSAGGLRIDAPGVNVAHPVYLTSTTYLNLLGDNNGDGVPDTANTATISSVINGAQRIRPVGGGTVILTATNTHSGTETWTPGAATVEFANVASLGTGFISPNWGGTFRYTGTGSQSTPCTLWIDNAGPPGGGTIEIQSSTGVLTLPNGGATINQPFYKTGPGTLILTAQGLSGGGLTVNGGTMTVGGGIGGVTPVTLNSGTLTLSGVISATAPVTVNNGTMTLAGASTYVFPTYVNGGTLVVSGSTGGGSLVTVANTATLAGNGTINGPVSLQSGGVLAPGANAIGKLTINNVLSLAGSTVMEISKAANTNDAIVGLTTVNYGGALVINQLDATPFVGGESYKLFAAVVYGGSFSSITLPSLPAGLSWDTTQLGVNGTIRVSATPVAPTLSGIVSAGGGSFTLSFSGPSGQSYKVLATNFVTAPVATWPVLTTGTFGATPATFTDLSATNDTDRFYLITSP
jgi:hypothetical protein